MKFKKNYQLKNFRFPLVILVLALSFIGILVVGSAKESLQERQIFGVVLGVAAMLVVAIFDYNWILNLYWLMYIVNVILLILVKLVGVEANGAQRWLNLGFTTLQPSDLTKIFMILFFAKFLMKHEDDINTPKTIIKSVLLILPSLVLIVTQPNLSNTICIRFHPLLHLVYQQIYIPLLPYRFLLLSSHQKQSDVLSLSA